MNWVIGLVQCLYDAIEGEGEHYPEPIFQYGLEPMLSAAVASAWLAGAVLLVNLLFRRWLTAGQMCLLWGLVLVRLLVPAVPQSIVSLQNLPTALERTMANPPAEASDPSPVVQGSLEANSAPTHYSGTTEAETSIWDWIDFAISLVLILWPIGVLFVLVRSLIAQVRFLRRVGAIPALSDARILELWADCCRGVGVPRVPAILQTDAVSQPALCGLRRTKLLLPSHVLGLADESLRMIMLHELAHLRRHDLAVNWLLLIVRAVHWCNPIAWLAISRYRSLREQACDAFVLRALQPDCGRTYGELLVELAEGERPTNGWSISLPSLLGFLGARWRLCGIRSRLRGIRSPSTPQGRFRIAAVWGLGALIAGSGFTDARTHTPTVAPGASLIPNNGRWFGRVRELGPRLWREYDLTSAIEGSATDGLTTKQARFLIEWDLKRLVAMCDSDAEDLENLSSSLPPPPESLPGFELNGNLARVFVSEGLHEEISTRLQAWTEGGQCSITVELRVFSCSRNTLKQANIPWERFQATSRSVDSRQSPGRNGTRVDVVSGQIDGGPVAFATIDDGRKKTLVQTVQDFGQGSIIFAPKLTLLNGEEGIVQSVRTRPFVTGLQVGAGGSVEPTIETFNEGTQFQLRAVARHDRTTIEIDGGIELSELAEVRTATLEIAGAPRTIQLPTIKRTRIDLSSKLDGKSSLLVGCQQGDDEEAYVCFALTPRLLQEGAELLSSDGQK